LLIDRFIPGGGIILRFKFIISILIVFFLLAANNLESKTALVLSGGGAKGFAHIGVLKVLEQHDVKIDFIVGTSMGCIIGSLYALGYTADQIEDFVVHQDWINLFSDLSPRRYLPMYQKDENEKYIGSVPLSGKRSVLPAGFIKGQKVYDLFSSATWQAKKIRDFKKLPIPLYCVATDIETGTAVLLDSGNMADVMRASMSIPGVFVPMEIGGKMYIDGGVANNFPTDEAKKLGAKHIVGVDVRAPLKKQEDIKSFFAVLEQSVSYYDSERWKANRKLCTVLVEPDTKDYDMMDFDKFNELIILGKKEAEKKIKQIVKVSSRLSARLELPQDLKIKINAIKIEGLEKINEKIVLSNLKIKTPSYLSQQELSEAIKRLYGLGFFDTIFYDFEKDNVQELRDKKKGRVLEVAAEEDTVEDTYVLFIRVKEQSLNTFRFGFNYTSYTNAAVLLNTTFRNMALANSRLSLDFNLSKYPAFKGQYYFYTTTEVVTGVRTEFLYNKFDINTFYNGSQINHYGFDFYAFNVNFEANISTSFVVGIGAEKEYNRFRPIDLKYPIAGNNDEFLSFYTFLEYDSLDNGVYPKKGIALSGEFRFVTSALSFDRDNMRDDFERLYTNGKFALPILKRFSIIADYNIGANIGDNIPLGYLFYLGGFRKNGRWSYPFVGLDYMEASAKNIIAGGLALQYEPFKSIFIILRANKTKLAENFTALFHQNNSISGAGLTLAWDGPIGPIDFTLTKDIKRNDFFIHFNVGYWF
jgi:NTE family protein